MDKKMPKRVNNIFKGKLTFIKMYEAYKRAAKGKRKKSEVILFEMDLANNLLTILQDINNGSYRLGAYRKFVVYEPKKREILALPFRDRVVHQWYIEEFIKPIFLPKFINTTYACIPERGVHMAVDKLLQYMKLEYKNNKNFYILKCDISKFFYSIDKKTLYGIISRYVKDNEFLEFTKRLIFDGTGKVKIPIGNYTSQFFANIYLNELDHFVKEKLKVKYYVRYMDDFIIVLPSKIECKNILREVKKIVEEKLHLTLNKKTNYFKNIQGVTFCGYRIFLNRKYLSKVNKKSIYKRVKRWNKLYTKKKLDILQTKDSFISWVRTC
jgi:retron-type reverse transcriptase